MLSAQQTPRPPAPGVAPSLALTPTSAGRFPRVSVVNAPLADLVRTASGDGVPPAERHRAFAEIVRRFQDFAFGLALSVLGDRGSAEDAAQESFVTAWQHLGSLREPEAFPGWFGQIVRSRCHRVTRMRKATVSWEAVGEGPLFQPESDLSGSDPVKAAERAERRQRVWDALGNLPAHQRTATVLYYLGEMDQGAIADFLRVPVTTVKKRVWAARKLLRERMQDYMDDTMLSVGDMVQSGAPSQGTDFQHSVALWTACDDGDTERLSSLIAGQPSAAGRADTGGTTLLHRAAERGHTDIVRLLLARGAHADAANQQKQTALHCLAASSCRVEIAEMLIGAGTPIGAVDADGQTALEIAALSAVPAGEASGDGFALAEVLLSRGGTLNLHAVAALDKPESVWSLVRDDKDALSRRNTSGDTPLHTACRAGYRRTVKALLDAGADVNLPNADGHTPLEVALQPGRKSKQPAQQAVVRTLRDKSATVSLRAAAMMGDVAALRVRLAETPKAVHEKDAHGATALHFAAWLGQADAAAALLSAGANPNAKDAAGRSPLSVRWRASDIDFRVADVLERAGATPNLDVALGLGRADQVTALLKTQSGAATVDKVSWAMEVGCPAGSVEQLLTAGATLTAHQAAFLGDVKRLAGVLARDPDAARSRDARRETPLHAAARAGQRDTARALVEAGASFDAVAGDGATPLYLATAGGHLDFADWLLAKGAKPDLATHRGDAALHAACAVGYADLAHRLIARGADVNRAGANRDTPLHRASERGHADVVSLLLRKGAEVNARNYWDGAALHVAAREGHPKVLKVLLASGAELLARDRWHRTGLHVAAYFDQPDAARTLLDAGIGVTELSYGFSTPLHTAADRGSVRVARLLVKRGADVNASTDFGRTPLHDAVGHGHVEMVDFLLGAGANPKRPNNRGMTPLHWAAAGGHLDIARLLLNAGADTTAKSQKDETPRDLAARHGHGDVLTVLS